MLYIALYIACLVVRGKRVRLTPSDKRANQKWYFDTWVGNCFSSLPHRNHHENLSSVDAAIRFRAVSAKANTEQYHAVSCFRSCACLVPTLYQVSAKPRRNIEYTYISTQIYLIRQQQICQEEVTKDFIKSSVTHKEMPARPNTGQKGIKNPAGAANTRRILKN